MDYKIHDTEKSFEAKISENLGGGEYVIEINGIERQLRILRMSSGGIEFLLDQKYHQAKYLEQSTSEMSLIVDNVPITLGMHTHFDKVVYKNSGGAESGSAKLSLKSQIPGKVISVAVAEGDSVKKGDVVCTLESMKMQVAVKAHRDGTIKSVKAKESSTVAKGDVIVDIG